MSDVQFNENQDLYQFRSRSILGSAQTPKLASLLIRTGIVKNERAAGRLLIVIMIVSFALSFYFFVSTASV
ncbi:MAG: hypothetical protein A3C06_01550 [Candidatus Taylorbacteria bacterium RIFCSPHIGHO2_02_FULL_46_13]|uniref:Uncharacterized protein n=1 Tax=Candidatus Taylorbacteria bacterium RIFCSPHIGHO2_02_FULL_46_13 TaxID=1802312 RepID=A0A1G2MR48_9BACT|nr:MAG: hypothetical protein A3C06_01550 [Candidatus Taylorbacteria bacterium RIFCSPHIGHO2_02_FULL_46_13]